MDKVASKSEEKLRKERKWPPHRPIFLSLSFLIKQSSCRTQCTKESSQTSFQSAALMHPIFDGSVLTIENRQYEEKKKWAKKSPCSLLFSMLLSFHEVNISKVITREAWTNGPKKGPVGSKWGCGKSFWQRKEIYLKRSDIKRIPNQDWRSLIQGRDPSEEGEISRWRKKRRTS